MPTTILVVAATVLLTVVLTLVIQSLSSGERKIRFQIENAVWH